MKTKHVYVFEHEMWDVGAVILAQSKEEAVQLFLDSDLSFDWDVDNFSISEYSLFDGSCVMTYWEDLG